jgi:hypothetical protein
MGSERGGLRVLSASGERDGLKSRGEWEGEGEGGGPCRNNALLRGQRGEPGKPGDDRRSLPETHERETVKLRRQDSGPLVCLLFFSLIWESDYWRREAVEGGGLGADERGQSITLAAGGPRFAQL